MITALQPFAEFSRRDLYEFRIGIEGESAAAAARNRSLADLDRLRRVMRQLDDVRGKTGLGLDEDFAFHLAVAEASGNDYFVSVLNSLRGNIYEGMLIARTATSLNVDEKLAAIDSQHRQIYEAILSRDEERARQGMREHLRRCKQSTAHWDLFAPQ